VLRSAGYFLITDVSVQSVGRAVQEEYRGQAKAKPKPSQSQAKAKPKPSQSQVKAKSKPSQSQAKAKPKPSQAKPSQSSNWGRRLALRASRRPPVC